jgi:hypothetical protein
VRPELLVDGPVLCKGNAAAVQSFFRSVVESHGAVSSSRAVSGEVRSRDDGGVGIHPAAAFSPVISRSV